MGLESQISSSASSLASLQNIMHELRLFPLRHDSTCIVGERSVALNGTGKLAMALTCSSCLCSLWGRDCRAI